MVKSHLRTANRRKLAGLKKLMFGSATPSTKNQSSLGRLGPSLRIPGWSEQMAPGYVDAIDISSWEIHRAMGVTQKTTWFMLQRGRLAMQSASGGKLGGEV